MRASFWSGILTASLLLAACTGGSSEPPGSRAEDGSGAVHDMLVLDTVAGATVVDSISGEVVATAAGAMALPDGSGLFAASSEGGATSLDALDPASGNSLASLRIRGNMSVQVVSDDGSSVALVESPEEGADAWAPVSRAETEIVVAHPASGSDRSSDSKPSRYVLEGNFVPEAFSANGKHLFMIQYLPALNPDRYKVASLELEDGDVYDVLGRFKGTWSEEMSGTRLQQALAPSGDVLYTLYSNQPPEYAEGFGPGSNGADPIAFVHVLQLRERWAYCAPLPKRFGPGPTQAKAIALSPDGSEIFVVDARGYLTRLGAEKLKHDGLHQLDLGLPPGDAASARFGPDGTLYVAGGSQVVAVDPRTLEVEQRWPVGAGLTGLALSPSGSALYAATEDGVSWLDPATGDPMGSIQVPGVEDITFVGPLTD